MSKLNAEFKDNKFTLGVDTNEDGENSIQLSVNLSEALQEIISRGEKLEGAKLVEFEFGLGGMKLKLDTDQDGEELLELEIKFAEIVEEGTALFMKKDEVKA